MEHRDFQDQPVKKANPVQLARLDRMEDMAHPVAMVATELLVYEESLAQLDNRDHKVPEDFQAQPVFREQKGIVVTLVPPVSMVKMDAMATLDHRVHKVNQVH